MGYFLLVYSWQTIRCDTEEEANAALQAGYVSYPNIYPDVYYVVGDVRHVVHYRSLPNAPSVQKCQSCGKPCKRSNKTAAIADYDCSKCGARNIVSLKPIEERSRRQ